MLTRAQAAQVMGMKTREITDVEEHGDGWVVTTFDGQRTLLEADPEPVQPVQPVTPAPRMSTRPAPDLDAPAGVRVSDQAPPAKQAPAKKAPGKKAPAGRKSKAEQEADAAAAAQAAEDAATLAELIGGPEKELLAWVGSDPVRAHAAHSAESDRQHPNVDLLIRLEQLADAS